MNASIRLMETVNGTFNLYGYLGGTDTASSVSLRA